MEAIVLAGMGIGIPVGFASWLIRVAIYRQQELAIRHRLLNSRIQEEIRNQMQSMDTRVN